jgi:general secretion pathway protein A
LYETFYGLRQKPFALLPDPRFLFASRTHRVALNLLEYGLSEQTGFVVLTGEVGTGKTTLVRHLLNLVDEEVVAGLVPPTNPSFDELLKWMLLAFDLDFAGRDRIEQQKMLIDFLFDRYTGGERCVLIIDEAQHLGVQALEQLRLFSNVNSGMDHILQFILVGQPELRATLQRPELRQFVQRITVHYDLEPLNVEDTTNYIRHRLEVAGGGAGLFSEEACAAVHYFSNGTPRLINALADLALVHGYADERAHVDLDLVVDAALARSGGGLSAFAILPKELSREQIRARVLDAAARNA